MKKSKRWIALLLALLLSSLKEKGDLSSLPSIMQMGGGYNLGSYQEMIKKSTEDAFRSTVDGYTSVIPETTNVQLQNGKAKYALYPVWILNTTWNGQKYTFAMNGQTGKLVGDLPMDKGAYNKYLWLTTAIGAAAVFAVQYLIWLL